MDYPPDGPGIVVSCFTGNTYETASPEELKDVLEQVRQDDAEAAEALLQEAVSGALPNLIPAEEE